MWVKIEGGWGINLETECFIYSITGRLTTILYAIIGCLIEKSLTLSFDGRIKPSFMCYQG